MKDKRPDQATATKDTAPDEWEPATPPDQDQDQERSAAEKRAATWREDFRAKVPETPAPPVSDQPRLATLALDDLDPAERKRLRRERAKVESDARARDWARQYNATPADDNEASAPIPKTGAARAAAWRKRYARQEEAQRRGL